MRVVLTRAAIKEFEKIAQGDGKNAKKIDLFLRDLEGASDPKALPNVKKVKTYEKRYRWRVGIYRVVGEIEDELLLITIIRISHRKNAYKD